MKLTRTRKFFPKTYHYLKTHVTNTSVASFIDKYHLKGLKLRNPKDNKLYTILPNELDHVKHGIPLEAINQFNDALDLSFNNCVVISYRTSSAPALVDDAFTSNLTKFAKEHFEVDTNISKYVDYDKLLYDNLVNNHIRTVVFNTGTYFVADLYVMNENFNYDVNQLEQLETAFLVHDKRVMKTVTINTRKRIRHDSKLFTKYIKPTLPLVMLSYPDYYCEQLKHGKLLYLVGTYLHA